MFYLLTCRFDVRDYPELCMAYKIPPSIQVDIIVEIRVEESSNSQWYYITMTAGDVQRQPRLTSALDINADDRLVNSMNLRYFFANACSWSFNGFYWHPFASHVYIYPWPFLSPFQLRWHYMCMNLQDIITMGINPNISDYTILGFALVSYQNELPFYIDEVSFSQYRRTAPQVRVVN